MILRNYCDLLILFLFRVFIYYLSWWPTSNVLNRFHSTSAESAETAGLSGSPLPAAAILTLEKFIPGVIGSVWSDSHVGWEASVGKGAKTLSCLMWTELCWEERQKGVIPFSPQWNSWLVWLLLPVSPIILGINFFGMSAVNVKDSHGMMSLNSHDFLGTLLSGP